MGRLLHNGAAFLRGKLYFAKALVTKNIKCNIDFVKYKEVYINANRDSTIDINSHVKVGAYTTISCLKGGKLKIGAGVGIGQHNCIVCHDSVDIGENTILGPNVLIYDHDHVFNGAGGVDKRRFKTEKISIGKNCWLGANVVVLKGTVLGDRCVVGAGCVLKGQYPDDSLITQNRQTNVVVINRENK